MRRPRSISPLPRDVRTVEHGPPDGAGYFMDVSGTRLGTLTKFAMTSPARGLEQSPQTPRVVLWLTQFRRSRGPLVLMAPLSASISAGSTMRPAGEPLRRISPFHPGRGRLQVRSHPQWITV